MIMENAEEILNFLEEFSKRKPKTIPQELNDYLAYVARTGDPVYQWALVKGLFKEKLLNVITDFYETTPGIDIPPYPNVDPFNYDTMKNSLIERLDSFTAAPFTVQRICELLTCPRKQYHRVDKYMRAIEKNILVVSTREPGSQRHIEAENGEPMEAIINGSDNNSEYNVDVEMEEMSWKENSEPQQSSEPQPSSSDTHISIDDIEARLKAKQEQKVTLTQEKATTQYESVTPPELNVTSDEQPLESKTAEESNQQPTTSAVEELKPDPVETVDTPETTEKLKKEEVMVIETTEAQTLVIPEIKVDDAEMTEQKLIEQATAEEKFEPVPAEKEPEPAVEPESKTLSDDQQIMTDESSSDSNPKEEAENKLISEIQTSSEESSSSSDNTDANSNSPKTVESNTDIQEESCQSDSYTEDPVKEQETEDVSSPVVADNTPQTLESDNYSISDVKSELPQPPPAELMKPEEPEVPVEPVKPVEPELTMEPVEAVKSEEVSQKEIDMPAEVEQEKTEVKMDSTEGSTENPTSVN